MSPATSSYLFVGDQPSVLVDPSGMCADRTDTRINNDVALGIFGAVAPLQAFFGSSPSGYGRQITGDDLPRAGGALTL